MSDVMIDIENHLPSVRWLGLSTEHSAKIGSAHASFMTLPLLFSPLSWRERGALFLLSVQVSTIS